MVFRAQVIDNSSFLTNGKIRVRILKYYYGNTSGHHNKFMPDLSETPELILEGQKQFNGAKTHSDVDVLVYSPIGGGQDYGMFFLPQVNSDGIVLRLGDAFENSDEYLWLGSTFDMVNNTIRMPSDSMTNINGVQDKGKNISVLDGALVIKLKSTKLIDSYKPEESKKDLDWKQAPIENLIIINKEKVLINHSVIKEKKIIGTDKIILDETGIKITSSIGNDTSSDLTLNNAGGFSLITNINKSQTTCRIESTSSGIEMIASTGAKSSFIKQECNNVTINADGTGVTIAKGVVNIKSDGNIFLDAKNVSLGKTGNRVVLCASNQSSISLSGGVILTTSDALTG